MALIEYTYKAFKAQQKVRRMSRKKPVKNGVMRVDFPLDGLEERQYAPAPEPHGGGGRGVRGTEVLRGQG